MPAERLPMRQVREVLRLKHVCGHSARQIAAAVGVSRYTVAEYLRRATVVGITWPVPPGLTRRPPPEPNAHALKPHRHPGWLPAECTAGFDRNRWLDSVGIDG
jgi:hypothetical protein